MTRVFSHMADVPVDSDRASVYEHGWQSWSPTGTYPVTATSPRPLSPSIQAMCYRPGIPAPQSGFQAAGLLAVDPGTGDPLRIYAARDGQVVNRRSSGVPEWA
jgi:alpha-galactosidase